MAKDHGPSVKNDKQYEGLRKKGMSKERAAKISNANAGSGTKASKTGGKKGGKKLEVVEQAGGNQAAEGRSRAEGRQEELKDRLHGGESCNTGKGNGHRP
jgi:hypothetical protein